MPTCRVIKDFDPPASGRLRRRGPVRQRARLEAQNTDGRGCLDGGDAYSLFRIGMGEFPAMREHGLDHLVQVVVTYGHSLLHEFFVVGPKERLHRLCQLGLQAVLHEHQSDHLPCSAFQRALLALALQMQVIALLAQLQNVQASRAQQRLLVLEAPIDRGRRQSRSL